MKGFIQSYVRQRRGTSLWSLCAKSANRWQGEKKVFIKIVNVWYLVSLDIGISLEIKRGQALTAIKGQSTLLYQGWVLKLSPVTNLRALCNNTCSKKRHRQLTTQGWPWCTFYKTLKANIAYQYRSYLFIFRYFLHLIPLNSVRPSCTVQKSASTVVILAMSPWPKKKTKVMRTSDLTPPTFSVGMSTVSFSCSSSCHWSCCSSLLRKLRQPQESQPSDSQRHEVPAPSL